MTWRSKSLRVINRFLLSILLLVLSSAVSIAETRYVVGVVPQFEARQLRAIWKPILDELTRQTGFEFIIRGSPSIPDFEREFNAGDFDIAYMNPYHIMLANKSQGYVPLVRDVGRKLHGILVVANDSHINTIADLQNKRIAFPAPNALGASLLIRAELKKNHNIDFTPLYVKSHSSVYLNVILGQAEAGGGVQKTLSQQKPEVREKLKIIYKTQDFAPHPIAAHPRVPEEHQNKIRDALIKMGETTEGKSILKKIPINEVGKAEIADYLPLEKLGLSEFYVKPN